MTERVFLLGAGASIGHSAGKFPGIRDFFELAKGLHLTVANDSARSVVTEFKGLEEKSGTDLFKGEIRDRFI